MESRRRRTGLHQRAIARRKEGNGTTPVHSGALLGLLFASCLAGRGEIGEIEGLRADSFVLGNRPYVVAPFFHEHPTPLEQVSTSVCLNFVSA